jgi:hypothetical protein
VLRPDGYNALRELIQSRAASVNVVGGEAMKGPDTSVTEPPPPAVARILDGPVGSVVAKVFESCPDKEFTVNAVIAELKQADPGINENSIRYTITELKRSSVIHHVRNQGHHQILKFTKPGEERPFPHPTIVVKRKPNSALQASSADVQSDLTVLNEATGVILKLQALVRRNLDALAQVAKLKSVLDEF